MDFYVLFIFRSKVNVLKCLKGFYTYLSYILYVYIVVYFFLFYIKNYNSNEQMIKICDDFDIAPEIRKLETVGFPLFSRDPLFGETLYRARC